MTRLVSFLIALGLCLTASVGCKSVRQRQASANSSSTSALAAAHAKPRQEVSIGQASYERLADNPDTDPYGRTPYQFGGSTEATTSGASKRC